MTFSIPKFYMASVSQLLGIYFNYNAPCMCAEIFIFWKTVYVKTSGTAPAGET